MNNVLNMNKVLNRYCKQCVKVNNLLKYNEMNEEIKNSENDVKYVIKTMETYCVSCKKDTANKNSSVRKTNQKKLMRV